MVLILHRRNTMTAKPFTIPVNDGELAAIDFGGQGTPVLLVHGTGHNANAWTAVARELVPHCHVIAIDLRGHGQTHLESTTAEQYWQDLGAVTNATSARILVGHSTGGYAICAATAAGLTNAQALCVVDGFVLEERAAAIQQQAQWTTPEAQAQLKQTYRYGWVTDKASMEAYVQASATEELNQGANPELARQVAQHSFTQTGNQWTRRPTLKEITTVSSPNPNAAIYPSRDLYNSIHCPITFVLASRGFYTDKTSELDAIVAAAPNRTRIDIDANHNVPMTQPAQLAKIILQLIRTQATSTPA